jgi:hypothetical protein
VLYILGIPNVAASESRATAILQLRATVLNISALSWQWLVSTAVARALAGLTKRVDDEGKKFWKM